MHGEVYSREEEIFHVSQNDPIFYFPRSHWHCCVCPGFDSGRQASLGISSKPFQG
jgi:hypothetical protein